MHRERASWEKYRERMSAEAKEFEHLKNKFQEDRAAFDKEKKSEEWGREGLRSKLQACEELLAKERKEWRVACENDNKKMFAVCSKITNLEAEVISLKEKIEEAKSDRERAEDVEIAELKRRLFEAHEKNESLEIDLVAEKVKADTAEEARKAAEEARKINTSALNVAQTNYAEAQSIVANSILNATELDKAVAALTDVVRAVGHRGGYLECTQHVEEALKQHFRTRHCSVTDQADEMLAKAEEVYDHLSLPVMELVMEALKHDDYVAQLKSILMVLETVELSDEEETTGGGGEE
ncbi:hypothetical protein HanRHA438_Chr09g0391521 [Helianthus annuus]|nr:hypothetical protein HanHA300_Chr09g0311791 [Helianthus annuus]KAJ0533531.1 hypothetical protein HanIR_Chr09g0409421 [Helianthus annuus]KAJ0541804.1 hypothetical protein HanHA89_Chr09g0332671 [Helianthus annuus]KAJ0706880.1 hypothetical protein HanLR1_Chr09g0312131 [Helianthus annuus]KAJ0710898.1 hypothetical protein HanOQP8_Chr09g0317691 [Helianthus annuus]